LVTIKLNDMKENKLILMQKKIEQLTNVVNGLIQKLQQVDVMAKGTLTAFQLSIGEEEWKKLVEELQDVEKRAQPEEKKFENVE
tara:strand:- start:253 stop:504 length:252 start_codon:yes stop_codon:yes gene_type:complete